MIATQAESKYKNIRSSYGRFLKKLKGVLSGSGRDAVLIPGEFASLEWLDQYITHRKSSSNFPRATHTTIWKPRKLKGSTSRLQSLADRDDPVRQRRLYGN